MKLFRIMRLLLITVLLLLGVALGKQASPNSTEHTATIVPTSAELTDKSILISTKENETTGPVIPVGIEQNATSLTTE